MSARVKCPNRANLNNLNQACHAVDLFGRVFFCAHGWPVTVITGEE
jgi:hypothetical protein